MAYIRPRTEELTGFQDSAPYHPITDFATDFAMVYGIDETMPQRVREYREAGFVVHLMTGIAWGNYQDYLDGDFDGRTHWDEGQVDRHGAPINHGVMTPNEVPYMVPTENFVTYLIERLKVAVDAGVEAIHMEEPEFWDEGGYSPAFQREFEAFYGEKWRPQHTDVDARYKAERLKTHLYSRAIARISRELKEYAPHLRFYVPTHSLVNYCQWKILSPEAELIGIPTVDGCIAQVWTGTSRCRNVYEGRLRERTFENAFLEYGVMQELVKGTGRRMWFLHDPIEDDPGYTWDNYRYNYEKTLVASLLHPLIHHYEVVTWPRRVFVGSYTKLQDNSENVRESTGIRAGAAPIPPEYATELSTMFNLCGDMDQPVWAFEGDISGVGVLMSDSALYQRTFPDGEVPKKLNDPIYFDPEDILRDPTLMPDFIQTICFPQFYGLAMPLLKWGLPLRPVQLDNVIRFHDYLADCRFLVLSYEFIKPSCREVNEELLQWVEKGGTLFYVGDGSDPYHRARFWWREEGYHDPAQHLFEAAGLGRTPGEGSYRFGKGRIHILKQLPAAICLKKERSDAYRDLIRAALEQAGISWEYRNDLTLHRGPYIISGVMDESFTDEPKILRGKFADLMAEGYPIIREKIISPDGCALLFDLDKAEPFRIVGTCARVEDFEETESSIRFTLRTADKIRSHTRLLLPGKPAKVDFPGSYEWDDESGTLLLTYDSSGAKIDVRLYF